MLYQAELHPEVGERRCVGEGANAQETLTLRADGRSTHQSVITAMDVLGRLGFAELNIATVRQDAAPAADTK